MAVVQCVNGHYYDDSKYDACPHCAGTGADAAKEDSVTLALAKEKMEDAALAYVRGKSAGAEHQHVEMDDERTIGLYSAPRSRRRVVGWLVCTAGSAEGQDYPLYSGFNRIGRGYENDVVIKEDMQISREEHCSIVYEEKKNIFYLVPKNGCLAYLDEKIAEEAQELSGRQEITIGETKLTFIAFCKGEWKWSNENQ